MSIKAYVLISLHLIPWALAMGAAFYFAFVAVPQANRFLEGEKRLQFLRRNVKYYSPFYLLMLSTTVITGAWRLTDYKGAFSGDYLYVVATPLIIKLILFLVVYLLAAYQSFGLGLRITGQGEKAMNDPVEAKIVDEVILKMRKIAILSIILMSATVVAGLVLSRISFSYVLQG